MKLNTLIELAEYMMQVSGFVTHDMYGDIVQMVRINLFRPLPPHINPDGLEFDPEEDDPILEAAWAHIECVYELFMCFLELPTFSSQAASPYINVEFVRSLVALFDSEDPRERDFLKTTLHRLYGAFLHLRPHIRLEAQYVFCRVAHEQATHNGVGELLEILGSIVNGFSTPIKDEHCQFLERALLPLHKARHLALFHTQLTYCVAQFLEKDETLSELVINGMLRFYPSECSKSACLFLSGLGQLLHLVEPRRFPAVALPVFALFARCIASPHYQVSERALTVWQSEYVLSLVADYCDELLPVIFPALYKTSKHHWHPQIRERAYGVLKQFMDIDRTLFTHCTENYKADAKAERKATRRRAEKWRALERLTGERTSTSSSSTSPLDAPPPVARRLSGTLTSDSGGLDSLSEPDCDRRRTDDTQ